VGEISQAVQLKTVLCFIVIGSTACSSKTVMPGKQKKTGTEDDTLLRYIYGLTNVQFSHINCVISLSYMFPTLNLGSSSGTHYLKSHTIYTNWYI
jgi:hypothetical protein